MSAAAPTSDCAKSKIGRRILSQHHRAATPIDCGQKQASGEEMTLKGLTQQGPLQKRTFRSAKPVAITNQSDIK